MTRGTVLILHACSNGDTQQVYLDLLDDLSRLLVLRRFKPIVTFAGSPEARSALCTSEYAIGMFDYPSDRLCRDIEKRSGGRYPLPTLLAVKSKSKMSNQAEALFRQLTSCVYQDVVHIQRSLEGLALSPRLAA